MAERKTKTKMILDETDAIANDLCFAKAWEPSHPTCIYCAAVKQCGTAFGKTQTSRFKSAKNKDLTDPLDSKVYITAQNVNDLLSPTGALHDDTFKDAADYIKEMAEAGTPMSVDDVREELERIIDREMSTREFIYWIYRLEQKYPIYRKDNLFYAKQ